MTIRPASESDAPTIRVLWEAFEREIPAPPHQKETWDEVWEEILEYVRDGIALVADADGELVGYALAKLESPRIGYLSDLYVRPESRRRGVAKTLLREVTAWVNDQGADVLALHVMTSNLEARLVYSRLGFSEESLFLYSPLADLEQRLVETREAASFGSIHVQTDDVAAVMRAVEIYVPRLPGGSEGSVVCEPRNGWTSVYDELCDRRPEMLRTLALDISNRIGSVILAVGLEQEAVVRFILIESGRVLDEYASVPEFYGPLPPGDVIGLGANPTVVSRLTGADPAQVREVARTAATPSELPPPRELLASVAGLLGVEAAVYGYADARELPGAQLIAR